MQTRSKRRAIDGPSGPNGEAPPAASLKDLGEDRAIQLLTRSLPTREDVIAGAGDDCAVVSVAGGEGRLLLLKTDAVIEGIHFLPGEAMARVGWKALCRAISDVASMGGVPAHALVTLAAQSATPWKAIQELYRGLRRAAKKFGVAIVGGETSRSNGPLFCSVALTGWVEADRCVFRSGGEAGDVLYVTGRLGGSFASGKHLDFTPRLIEARWLTEHVSVKAMMDLSDGLGADLPRMARASGVGFDLLDDAIPCSKGCSLTQALNDGEDFELLFAIDPADGDTLETRWQKRFPRTPLTRIGQFVPATKHTAKSGRKHAQLHGFDHFQ